MTTLHHLLERKGRDVFSIGPDSPVLDAIRTMADRHVGALVVIRGGELVGIVSERDYARKVILLGRSAHDTPVQQIMSTPVLTAAPQQTVDGAMRIMTERRVRHLPVVESGKVCGVISIGDLVKAVIEDQRLTIEQLEEYIHR